MVRDDHKHDDDNPNTESSGRDCCAGLSLLETGQKAAISLWPSWAPGTQKARQAEKSLRGASGKDA